MHEALGSISALQVSMMKRYSILAWYSMFLRIVHFSQDAQLWPLVGCREMKWNDHSQKKDYPRVNQTSATFNIRLWVRHRRSPVWLGGGFWLMNAEVSICGQPVPSEGLRSGWSLSETTHPTEDRKQRARKGPGHSMHPWGLPGEREYFLPLPNRERLQHGLNPALRQSPTFQLLLTASTAWGVHLNPSRVAPPRLLRHLTWSPIVSIWISIRSETLNRHIYPHSTDDRLQTSHNLRLICTLSLSGLCCQKPGGRQTSRKTWEASECLLCKGLTGSNKTPPTKRLGFKVLIINCASRSFQRQWYINK